MQTWEWGAQEQPRGTASAPLSVSLCWAAPSVSFPVPHLDWQGAVGTSSTLADLGTPGCQDPGQVVAG